jgi:phosphatidylglycerophosphate synthase
MIIQGPGVYSSELVLTSIALAGISDYADGYLARRWNQTSNFGSFFDAAADKIFVSSVGVGMAATGQLPAWIVGLFVLRDCGFLASGFWRRANALKFENLTWRQYFAIDTVKREDEREDNGVVEESGRVESSSSVENSDTSRVAARKEKSDWEAFNSTEKWEPLFVGKVATALQMGLLAVACGQTLDHIPLLFDTYETQKQVISTTTENFAHFTFAATAYATAHYAKAYFSHPGWKELKQKREERREERRDYVRASVRDIRDSAKTKYQVSKEKILQRVAKSETDFRQRRQSLKRHRQHQHQQQQETTT